MAAQAAAGEPAASTAAAGTSAGRTLAVGRPAGRTVGAPAGARLAMQLGGVAFAASLGVRLLRLNETHFARDQAVALWMALDAVRGTAGRLPDHGLVSSVLALQPPGLVWLVLPPVWAGGGDPRWVMAWFAVLASVGVGLLVWALARMYGPFLALVAAGLLASSPADALAPALLWHVSLYMGGVAVVLAAGIRLRDGGSRWWAALVTAVPLAYVLIHYSGLALAAAALLVLPRSRWRELGVPLAVGGLVGLAAWLPFLRFEATREWQDLLMVLAAGAGGQTPATPADGLANRLAGFGTAVSVWGTGRWVEVSRVSQVVVAFAALGAAHGIWKREPLATSSALVLVVGSGLVAVFGMGQRADIVMLWNTPLLLLAALGISRLPGRWLAAGVLAAIVAGNLFIFWRAHDQFVARGESLQQNVARAQLGDAWQRSADDRTRTPPEASRYVPGDPPVVAGTGSEVWYLREVAQPGAGRAAAAADAAANALPAPESGAVQHGG